MNTKHKAPTIEQEEIILQVNRHWVQLVKPFVALIIGWFVAILLFNLATISRDSSFLTSGFHFLGATLILIIVHHWFFYTLIHWKLSWSIITTKRVIHFRNLPFVRNDLLYVRIDEIHEVEEREHGLMPNILDYGSVIINLAAVTETISLNYIPHPVTFSNLIEIIRENKNEEIEILKDLCRPYCKKYKLKK